MAKNSIEVISGILLTITMPPTQHCPALPYHEHRIKYLETLCHQGIQMDGAFHAYYLAIL